MADIEYLKKIDARIAELVAAKNAELNSESLEADLALESNVREVARLYDNRSFSDLANVSAMIVQQCRKKWTAQKTNSQAMADHARMPAGVKVPHLWNPPENSYFRAGAPVVISSASGVGKSTTARNIIAHNIMNKIPTVYVTNEDMKAEAIIGLFTIYTRIMTGRSISFMEAEAWNHNAHRGKQADMTEAKALQSFASLIEKRVDIIEAEYWSMSQILYGIDDAENRLGVPAQCMILDYVQRVDPEPGSRQKDIRLQMIEASRMWANYVKSKKKVGIIISQMNDNGKTAESTQFEKDAGQWLVIQRQYDETTDTFSDEVNIRFRKGRRTGTGRARCFVDPRSGAFIPSPGWTPAPGVLDFK